MKRLFGTDGIRGAAGAFPLDEATVAKVGAALTRVLATGVRAPRVLVGRDTRESGEWIEDALASGVAAAGGDLEIAGIVTTAGVAHMTRTAGFDAGVMISASHNPFNDNGIKVFSSDGYKLPDAQEARIEAMVLDEAAGSLPEPAPPAAPPRSAAAGLLDAYRNHLVEAAGGVRLDGMSVVLDCANGAAHETAPAVFAALGARVHALSVTPDGTNINSGCGALHPGAMCRAVTALRADLGCAFDGDADRAIACDETGQVCDGDFILHRMALAMRDAGSLAGGLVVATVMSNLWLEKALGRAGIRMRRAPVGDKYVLEEMIRTGARLGGEQSGHVVFLDHATTGDGILTAVMLAAALRRAGAKMSDWRSEVRPYPQVLLNVRVGSRPDLDEHPVIGPAAASVREALGDGGRLLLRYSGTEPLARVMIEGEEADKVGALARELAGVIAREIGER